MRILVRTLVSCFSKSCLKRSQQFSQLPRLIQLLNSVCTLMDKIFFSSIYKFGNAHPQEMTMDENLREVDLCIPESLLQIHAVVDGHEDVFLINPDQRHF